MQIIRDNPGCVLAVGDASWEILRESTDNAPADDWEAWDRWHEGVLLARSLDFPILENQYGSALLDALAEIAGVTVEGEL